MPDRTKYADQFKNWTADAGDALTPWELLLIEHAYVRGICAAGADLYQFLENLMVRGEAEDAIRQLLSLREDLQQAVARIKELDAAITAASKERCEAMAGPRPGGIPADAFTVAVCSSGHMAVYPPSGYPRGQAVPMSFRKAEELIEALRRAVSDACALQAIGRETAHHA